MSQDANMGWTLEDCSRMLRLSLVVVVVQVVAAVVRATYVRSRGDELEYDMTTNSAYLLASLATCVGVGCIVFGKSEAFSVWWRAAIIGSVFSCGLHLATEVGEPWSAFGVYLVIMAIFHYSEFVTTAITNPQNLSTDSFLLNHSTAYHLAAVISWTEYIIEAYLWPELKSISLFQVSGVAVCLAGEVFRKLAMAHAGQNFSHVIEFSHREDHVLVTSGVFSLVRHPSYVGWFWWSVGTQIALANPFCVFAYAVVSWKFFAERIQVEEQLLLYFFGQQYVDYKHTVPSGLPFICGYSLPEADQPKESSLKKD